MEKNATVAVIGITVILVIGILFGNHLKKSDPEEKEEIEGKGLAIYFDNRVVDVYHLEDEKPFFNARVHEGRTFFSTGLTQVSVSNGTVEITDRGEVSEIFAKEGTLHLTLFREGDEGPEINGDGRVEITRYP